MMRCLYVLPLVAMLAVPALAGDPYDPIGRRDPFRGLLHSDPGIPIIPTHFSVLGQYELDQLTLVGVVGDDDGRYAMVEPPDGPGALLLPGSRLGKRAAVVLSIGPDRLVAREERRLGDGTLLLNDHTLALAETSIALPTAAPGP